MAGKGLRRVEAVRRACDRGVPRKVLSGVEDLKARKEKFDTEADRGTASEHAAAISETWQRYLQEARRLSG
jgi:hypothetical protein